VPARESPYNEVRPQDATKGETGGDTAGSLCRLDRAKIEKIHELEEFLGTYVLASEPVIRLADLEPEQLEELKTVEKELGVILVAYQDL